VVVVVGELGVGLFMCFLCGGDCLVMMMSMGQFSFFVEGGLLVGDGGEGFFFMGRCFSFSAVVCIFFQQFCGSQLLVFGRINGGFCGG